MKILKIDDYKINENIDNTDDVASNLKFETILKEPYCSVYFYSKLDIEDVETLKVTIKWHAEILTSQEGIDSINFKIDNIEFSLIITNLTDTGDVEKNPEFLTITDINKIRVEIEKSKDEDNILTFKPKEVELNYEEKSVVIIF